jgi:hypothetical protein
MYMEELGELNNSSHRIQTALGIHNMIRVRHRSMMRNGFTTRVLVTGVE